MDDLSGVIFNIQRFSIHDGPGIRTAVFMQGCPLRCLWCHNPEGQGDAMEKNHGNEKLNSARKISCGQLMKKIESDRVFYDESGGGVTFTGGEPLLQIDFLRAVLELSRELDIHTAIETCGYATWADFKTLLPFCKLFLYDLKIIDTEKHKLFTGKDNNLILANLIKLSSEENDIVLRMTVLPGINTDTDNIYKLSSFLIDNTKVRNIELLRYHDTGQCKYEHLGIKYRLSAQKKPTETEMAEIASLFQSQKFNVTWR